MMRVAVLTSSYPRFPGDYAGVFVRSLTDHFAKLGHTPFVLAPYEPSVIPDPTQPYLKHFRYLPVAGWHQLGYGLALDNDRSVRRRAFALIPAYLAAATAALLHVVREQRPDVLHCHWVIPNGPVATLVSALAGVPLVLTLHGSDVFVAERLRPAGLLAKAALRQAAMVTACSPDLADGALRLGARAERLVTLPWGADPALFAAGDGAGWRRRLAIPPEALVVLAAGRLVEKKGFAYLLQAAPAVLRDHPQAVFVVAGDGPLFAPLHALASDLGIQNAVRFPGSVPWEDMPDVLHAADLFAAPSVRDASGNLDGLPTVILEAMAAGLPVVASDLAGISLAVRHGEHGLLVRSGDHEALAAALGHLLAHPEERRRMAAGARQKVEQELNWTAVAGRFVDLFQQARSRRS